MSLERERALMEACCAHFGAAAGLDEYLKLYAPGAVLHGYGPEPIRGTAGIRAFYEGILAAFADSRLVLEDTFGEGDRLATRFRLEATHAGPFMGVPATGRPVAFGGITILRFGGGRCVERWSVADFVTVLMQIGALPTPG